MKRVTYVKCPHCGSWNLSSKAYSFDDGGNSVFKCFHCKQIFAEFECETRTFEDGKLIYDSEKRRAEFEEERRRESEGYIFGPDDYEPEREIGPFA